MFSQRRTGLSRNTVRKYLASGVVEPRYPSRKSPSKLDDYDIISAIKEWISYDDHENCVISYLRKGYKEEENVVVVCNLTPTVREHYKIGLPTKGKLSEIFNSDDKAFGGSGIGNKKQITIKKDPWNGKDYSAEVTLPPLAVTIFKFK